MQTNPEQWAVDLGQQLGASFGGRNTAARLIQAAFAEREAQHIAMEKRARDLSIMIVQHLGGGSEWFSQVGDEYYADPKAISPELQRRKTDAQITKSALVRANRANAEQAEREARLVGALEAAIGALEDDTGLDEAICCSGHECGCRGSSHRQLLMYNLSTTLKSREAGHAQ